MSIKLIKWCQVAAFITKIRVGGYPVHTSSLVWDKMGIKPRANRERITRGDLQFHGLFEPCQMTDQRDHKEARPNPSPERRLRQKLSHDNTRVRNL